MATKIILKKSTTGGSAPLSGSIDVGELAINLADRKIYAKDGGGSVVTLNGAYVDTVAPSNAVEGDLWYDTSNNLLKAHNGSGFVSAGYQTLAALEDTSITAATSGDFLRHNGTAWVDSAIQNSDITTAMVTQHKAALTLTASQVTDFDTEVANNSAVAANTAKVSNVTTNLSKTATATDVTINSSDGTDVSIGSATTLVAGLMTKVIFDQHTVNNSKVSNVSTNLSKTATATDVTINSSDGTNVAIGAATDLIAGLVTGAEHAKLGGIEAGADVTDTANVTAAGALMDSELTNLVAVKAINQGLTTTSNVDFNNLVLAGNLTVNGTTTSVNSNQVSIGDSVITLNSDEVGVPSQNSGFEVERGTSANVAFIWNETDDAWDLANETLQNVVINGGSY